MWLQLCLFVLFFCCCGNGKCDGFILFSLCLVLNHVPDIQVFNWVVNLNNQHECQWDLESILFMQTVSFREIFNFLRFLRMIYFVLESGICFSFDSFPFKLNDSEIRFRIKSSPLEIKNIVAITILIWTFSASIFEFELRWTSRFVNYSKAIKQYGTRADQSINKCACLH